MEVRVEIDEAKIRSRFEGKSREGLIVLKGQIAADTAEYVPRVTGALEGSVKPSDTTSEPFLKWNAPYARRQYYGEFQHSRQAHPKATRLWFEVAKGINLSRWIEVAKRAFKGA
jgi:hypothetical protein